MDSLPRLDPAALADAHIVLTKSPKPSTDTNAARWNGETRNELARWARWCSTLCICARASAFGAPRLAASCSRMSRTFKAFCRRSWMADSPGRLASAKSAF